MLCWPLAGLRPQKEVSLDTGVWELWLLFYLFVYLFIYLPGVWDFAYCLLLFSDSLLSLLCSLNLHVSASGLISFCYNQTVQFSQSRNELDP